MRELIGAIAFGVIVLVAILVGFFGTLFYKRRQR